MWTVSFMSVSFMSAWLPGVDHVDHVDHGFLAAGFARVDNVDHGFLVVSFASVSPGLRGHVHVVLWWGVMWTMCFEVGFCVL